MTTDRQPTTHISERAVLLTAALGTMLAPLNSTMIVVALPEILDDFGHSLAWGSWIVISYLVAMAAVQPLGGSLGDRYGRRRMLLIGLTAFLAATVVAALAPSVEVLLVARTVQALSGAMAIPNGTALVRSLIPPERQGRTFGTIGSAIAVAAAAGPPLGGVITDAFGWRWIFAINLLLIIPALLLASRLPGERGNRDGSFDLRGALLMTGGVRLAGARCRAIPPPSRRPNPEADPEPWPLSTPRLPAGLADRPPQQPDDVHDPAGAAGLPDRT
jgi:multidrug resistance protein